MSFTELYLANAKLVVETDASFSNSRGLSIQLWYVILITDEEETSDVILVQYTILFLTCIIN